MHGSRRRLVAAAALLSLQSGSLTPRLVLAEPACAVAAAAHLSILAAPSGAVGVAAALTESTDSLSAMDNSSDIVRRAVCSVGVTAAQGMGLEVLLEASCSSSDELLE